MELTLSITFERNNFRFNHEIGVRNLLPVQTRLGRQSHNPGLFLAGDHDVLPVTEGIDLVLVFGGRRTHAILHFSGCSYSRE